MQGREGTAEKETIRRQGNLCSVMKPYKITAGDRPHELK